MFDGRGVWVAVLTPFSSTAERAVDHAALKRLVARLKAARVKGIVALGSTGEPWSLGEAEQTAVLDTILSHADGMPVVAGLGGNHVGQMHQRLSVLNGLPLAGVISAPPPYARPSQAGLIEHFKRLADLSRAPFLLYDIPYRTGVALDLSTILALAEHGNIVGIKDCGGSPAKTQALIEDGRLAVLAGEDVQVFSNLCLGGAGAITAAANVCPEAFVAMFEAVREGRIDDGRKLQHALRPLIDAMFAEPNPSLVKAALSARGLTGDGVRAPLLGATDAGRAGVLKALAAFDAATLQSSKGSPT
jgi:4-hydroxy-tetrahydrodipicolinate synthase